MKRRCRYLLALLVLPVCLHAQPAGIAAGAPLPLRNLLIEVRQDDGSSNSSERVAADVNARVQAGRTEADIALEARARQSERSGRAQQQVLVLNGRPAAIVLGQSQPLRLRQFITRNGVRVAVPGTIWLQAGTGFTATPIWEGGDSVYLELTATQGRQPLAPGASTSTTLMLPLDEWMTVADSEDMQEDQRGAFGLAGGGREQRRGGTSLRVQVRVSVR
jgi:hypothetical protein